MSFLLPLVAGTAVMAAAVVARVAILAGGRHDVAGRLPRTDLPVDRNAGKPRLRLPAAPVGIGRAFERAALPVDADVAWSALLAAAATATTLGIYVGGPVAGLLAFTGAVAAPAIAVVARRGEATRRFEAAVPAVMEGVARSLRTGASMRQAISETAVVTGGAMGLELTALAAATEHGGGLVACLESFAIRRPTPGVRLSVAALCLAVETGGSQARAIDGVASTLRERLAAAAEMRALSAQARISALVIGLAPLAFGTFAMATDPATADLLLHTGLGWFLVASGLLLDAIGWIWMRHLTGLGV